MMNTNIVAQQSNVFFLYKVNVPYIEGHIFGHMWCVPVFVSGWVDSWHHLDQKERNLGLVTSGLKVFYLNGFGGTLSLFAQAKRFQILDEHQWITHSGEMVAMAVGVGPTDIVWCLKNQYVPKVGYSIL